MSVCLSVNIFKLEYLRNQWANRNEVLSEPSLSGGRLHSVFGQIRSDTLVSMATDSSHGVIMGKMFEHSSSRYRLFSKYAEIGYFG